MPPLWDVFLSHGSPDKPWVESLAAELQAQGLRPFLDAGEMAPGHSFPQALSEGLAGSRFFVLILSPHSSRPWVDLEWASFLARHGPLGRLIPVLLEPTEIPAVLASIQRIDATHRDAARVAREIAILAGRPGELGNGGARRLVLAQDLSFHLIFKAGELRVADPLGRLRKVTPPWEVDNRFTIAHHFYDRLSREPAETDGARAELIARAATLGSLLFDLLFDEAGRERLSQAMIPGRPRPLITIRSEDNSLLALPWELLWLDGSFLLRDARVDLARSTPGEVGVEALLREPDEPLRLVVNVAAPEGSRLDYEGESYRITRALSERCRFVPTELGSLDDLVDTVRVERPTAIHFSGHGAPGTLAFEDDEGREDVVSLHDLVATLRRRIDGALPPLVYLASCHGNDSSRPGAESSAACLHREGVPQVVGYYGPIVDELSTRAEVAFYRALAAGETTRYAIRQARQALAAPFWAPEARHKPRSVAEPGEEVRAAPMDAEAAGARHSHPFAWAQLVFYHRGPDHPLSLPIHRGARSQDEALRRTFQGAGDRRVLTAGFIGRRSELHRVRRKICEGERVFVFQGLGGLGKSTLALQVLPMLLRGEEDGDALTLWCQEAEPRPDRAQALVDQLLEHCRKRFGIEWEPVVHTVDRQAGDDPVRRFILFLDALLRNVPRLVLYLDNLESLLVSPREAREEEDEAAFGQWASPDLGWLWRTLADRAQGGDRLYLVASCRYRNPDFSGALLPVSPLPPDALYRLMGWFPALRRLSGASRARLVERLAGHPRAVEYANDLLAHALVRWNDGEGLETKPGEAGSEREWEELVEPLLPAVREKLWDNLLLAEIWERVLAERARRMLFRMTLLRRPWKWKLAAILGEKGESGKVALTTAERLRRTSLLEAMELSGRRYTLHPATAQFVRARFAEDEVLRRTAHRRLGDHLDAKVRVSHSIEEGLEAGHHLFQAGEHGRACDLLVEASGWLQNHGRAREGLQILVPFLAGQVLDGLTRQAVGSLLNAVGQAHADLGELERAIGLHEQALVIAREAGDREEEGVALNSLGSVHRRLGAAEKAIDFFEQALAIYREDGERQGVGSVLCNLGLASADLEELDKAIGFYEQALGISRRAGDRRGEGSILGNLGLAFSALGQLERALGFLEQQLIIVRQIGDRWGEGNALANMGMTYHRLRDLRTTIELYEKALVVKREIGDRQGEGNVLGNLGTVYDLLGEKEKAVRLFERRLAMAREMGDRRGEAAALMNLGINHGARGENGRAGALLEQALEIGRSIKDPQIIRNSTGALADLHLSHEKTPESPRKSPRWRSALDRIAQRLSSFLRG